MKHPLQPGSHPYLEVQAHPPDIISQQAGNSHPQALKMFLIFCGFSPFLLCTSATHFLGQELVGEKAMMETGKQKHLSAKWLPRTKAPIFSPWMALFVTARGWVWVSAQEPNKNWTEKASAQSVIQEKVEFLWNLHSFLLVSCLLHVSHRDIFCTAK